MKKIKAVSILLLAVMLLSLAACNNSNLPAQVAINSAEDLNNLRIAVQEGTTGDLIASEDVTGATVTRFKKPTDAAVELNNARVDCIILDEMPAKKIVENNSGLKILDFSPTEEVEMYALAIAKENTELLDQVNAALMDIVADGTYEILFNKFINNEDVELPTYENSGENGDLIMGTEATFEPFEFRDDNNDIVGFDIELMKYVAAKLGRNLVVEDMNFDSLIAALQTGKIDVIAAGMTNTEERRANVNFTTDYYTTNQVIIVRK